MISSYLKFKTDNTTIAKAAVSLIASGVILFTAIGFAWFAIFKQPQAEGLTLKAVGQDCKVTYTSDNSSLANVGPGVKIPIDINVTDITKTGLLTVTFKGITCDPPILVDGAMHDIRDVYSITLTSPVDARQYNVSQSLSGLTDIDVISGYSAKPGDMLDIKLNLEFLQNPPGISDLNAFQDNVGLSVSEVSAAIT